MPRANVRIRVGLGLALSCASACSDGDPRVNGAGEGQISLPGCEGLATNPCPVKQDDCQLAMAELAACAWGGPQARSVTPPVSFISQEEYRELVYQALLEQDAFEQDEKHWVQALELLGLASSQALAPEALADSASGWVGAYYDPDESSITMITRDDQPGDMAYDSAVLVHEYVHALQDDRHDLIALEQRAPATLDAQWALSALVEGEAELHTTRVLAVMLGLDPASLDLGAAFENVRLDSEAVLFGQPERFLRSESLISYAYGAKFAHAIWDREGRTALRALFETPPESLYTTFASVHGVAPASFEPEQFPEPTVPETGGHAVFVWTSLGPWGLHIMGDGSSPELGLSWRGDQLAIFELAGDDTGLRWQIELADSEGVSLLEPLLLGTLDVEVRVSGTRVVVAASSGALPDFLLEPGEPPGQ